jgi:hypothetical protein
MAAGFSPLEFSLISPDEVAAAACAEIIAPEFRSSVSVRIASAEFRFPWDPAAGCHAGPLVLHGEAIFPWGRGSEVES